MKASNYLKVLPLIFLISCSKILEKEDRQYIMQVFDYNTTTPVPEVRIDMYYCAVAGGLLGCTQVFFATNYTDNNGKYVFNASYFNSLNTRIDLSKDKYWNTGGGEGSVYMMPEGWMDLRLVRKHVYPDSSFFNFDIYGESRFSRNFIVSAPVDSVVKIRGFGNQVNKINWIVARIVENRALCTTCTATDTLASGVITKSLGKFTSTAVTLEY